ncbi:MAG: membrane protein insertase YidC [Candidatus Eisenbacteria sp.]|nr:membrane protein insertase YidC [Candidatus Eisenbacteria bacterium]
MQKTDSGGFDKRTLIAFALMILVWVAFTQLMPQQEKPQQASQPQVAGEDAAGTYDAEGTPALPAREPAPGTAHLSGERQLQRGPVGLINQLPAEPREIRVKGDHYQGVFQTRGATLCSWRLLDYTDAAGQPVELVQDLPGALAVRLEGPEGSIDLSGTVFTVEESWEEGDTRGTAGDGSGAGGGRPRIRVLRFVAEGVADGAGQPVLRIERVYRIDPTRYDMQMELLVAGISNYRNDHHLVVGWERGIPNLETQHKLEVGSKAAMALLGNELVKDGFGGGQPGCGCGCGGGKADRGGERSYDGMLRWAGVKGKYFCGILIPEEETEATFIAGSNPAKDEIGMRVVLPLAYEGTSHFRFTVYAGPIDYGILKQLDARVERNVTRIVDFGAKLIAPISKAMLWFLTKAYTVIPNYGVGIIVLTILMRLLFHPLNVKALRSQRKMQELKPHLDLINKEHKDNPELRTKKTMELHKKHGINPLGGCLPLLPQMPVFYALWSVLPNAIELRKAPFMLWVNDLASPDTVGQVMGVPINILPILMALTMFWQQRMTPTDPKQAPMLLMMPLIMVFFFYAMPSGLVLYWTVSNVLAIGQQMLMKPVALSAAEAGEGGKSDVATKRKHGSAK